MSDYIKAEPGANSQGRAIIKYLEAGNTLTAIEALEKFGTFRLASRINDLRGAGYNIQGVMVQGGDKRFKRYWLEK